MLSLKKSISISVLTIGSACLLSACESTPEPATETVSIPFDPYDYNPSDADAEAQKHCEAYGLNARFVDETADVETVRWRYRNYDCVPSGSGPARSSSR